MCAFELDQAKLAEVQEPQPEALDIESDDVPIEIKQQAMETALTQIRDALQDIPDYVVFASTARFLQGMKRDIDSLKEVFPGDLDVAVESLDSLNEIRRRLRNIPGVKFANKGRYKRYKGEEVRRLGGVLQVEVQGADGPVKVDYPFEFFYKSIMVDPQAFQRRKDTAFGFKVLTLQELRKQYDRNLRHESRVFRNTKEVAEFLLDPSVEEKIWKHLAGKEDVGEDSEEMSGEQILDFIGLKDRQAEIFYGKRDQIEADGGSEDNLVKATSILLSGFKTKIEKRIESMQAIDKELN